MKVSIMQKFYKGNKYVFYVNGRPLTETTASIVHEMADILKALGIKVPQKNYVSEPFNDVPNNEMAYTEKPLAGQSIELNHSQWKDEKGYYGYNISSEKFSMNTILPINDDVFNVLTKLGANVVMRNHGKLSYDPTSRFNSEELRVFFITYEDSKFNQWSGKEGFRTVAEAKQKLRDEGYFETSRGFEKEPKGWAGKSRAYITPIVIK